MLIEMTNSLIKKLLNRLPIFSSNPNPYIRLVLKQRNDSHTEEIIEKLPQIANAISQGANAIYLKLIYPQFQDYEARYECVIVAQIDDGKKTEIIRVIISFMVYTFYNRMNVHDSAASVPFTHALHFEIYKNKPEAGSFADYLTYQNPNFEDPKMAPSFKFGNEIAQIMATMDMAFLFMASQQAVLVAEITQKILDGMIPPSEAAS